MKEEEKKKNTTTTKNPQFWKWAIASVIFRLILIYFPQNLNLATRPEVSTPVTSLRRLAEGYWLKQSSMSPYAGSMYHGSPLLLLVLGPLTMKKIEGQPFHLLCSLVSVIADFISAMLIRATGFNLRVAYCERIKLLDLGKRIEISEILSSEDIAALVYLWNPFTIVTCLGFNTTPVENLFIILSLYGACIRVAPLAAFGWVVASHLSLYPTILIIPLKKRPGGKWLDTTKSFSWKPVGLFFVRVSVWTLYTLVLCGIFMRNYGGLSEMFSRTYGFILTVKDLSPNIGVLWYFFAEVFEFFRDFFLIVFHVNILFMIMPLAIRLKHRPCFLAFVYMAICSMLKPYPSGTGNANFYFATGMAYACFQIVLVVESVSAMLNHDRKIRKLVAANISLTSKQ
ncbi:unnamed protein product [Withania somnifera]